MSAIRAFWLRLFGLLWRNEDQERDVDEEFACHLEMRIEDGIRSGMTPAEARRVALIESGGLDSAKEAWRDRRGLPHLEDFGRDIRYALRTLRRSPGFSATALLTLALGIGANTAIFSLVDAFLLRSLPVKEPQELVLVRSGFPYSTFEQFRDRNHCFSGIFAYDESHVTAVIDGRPEYLDGDFVSGTYFETLGVNAIVGRTFRSEDDQLGRQPVAVISCRYWIQRFQRAPSVIGKTVYLADTPFTIIGVTPPSFFGRNVAGRSADIVLPMFMHNQLALKDHDSVAVMARLRPGVSLERARTELDVIYRQILTGNAGGAASPRIQAELQARKIELRSGIRGTSNANGAFETELRILETVVGIALLIACVNVSNLMLARGAQRQREIALRLSIGASRSRLLRQLLTESTVLAIGGGVLGLVFAKAGLGLLMAVLSYGHGAIPFDLGLNARVLLYTGAISLFTGILFGLAPALAAARVDLATILKGSEGMMRSGRLRLGATSLFVVAQVALSLVLLIGSGLMIRTLQALYEVDFGFERQRVIAAWVFPALAGYDHAKEMSLYQELYDRFNRIPGVRSATLLRIRLLRGGWYRDLRVQSEEIISGQAHRVRCDPIGPRFFETLGIALVSGREFSPADSETAARVAIISEAMARKFFPNQNPIGQHVGFSGRESGADLEIVGVVKDIRHRVPEDRPVEAVYIPYTQAPALLLGQMNLVVRAVASMNSIVAAMRHEIQSINLNLPLVDVQTEAGEIDDANGGQRSLATLLGAFGILALTLTSVGLYGTMSQAVRRKTRELGIRMALGAEKPQLLWMVLREAFLLVLIGVVIGIPVAAAGTRLLANMLFDVRVGDPMTILGAVLGIVATAAAAACIPGLRATRVDPMAALRHD
jgi:predicted permease